VADTTIVELQAFPWLIELTEPFGIATGAQTAAENVLVRVRLADGTVGIGEAAPFPAVNGETQADAVAAVVGARDALVGTDAARFRHTAAILRESIRNAPSARAAIETAVLDAVTRRAGMSLQKFFGGAEDTLETDITIVTGDAEHAHASALRAAVNGFTTLKVKVGGDTLDGDVARLESIILAAPHARLVLDANGSLSADAAVELVERIGTAKVALFEQPTAHDDLEGMHSVRRRTRVPVAADESARSATDVARLAAHRAADVVNVKVTKCGLVEACDMIAAARSFELGLMIGGMVETPLAMTVSACLAAGHGGFAFVDLDPPFFMKSLPTRGGCYDATGPRAGPTLRPGHIVAGHGVQVRANVAAAFIRDL
jgi:L-alanine-DL-glutamate epimerase-like enolase superfamily enzyme